MTGVTGAIFAQAITIKSLEAAAAHEFMPSCSFPERWKEGKKEKKEEEAEEKGRTLKEREKVGGVWRSISEQKHIIDHFQTRTRIIYY